MAIALPGVARPAVPDLAAFEDRMLDRFAPVVILAPGERALPANVDWYLERATLDALPRRGDEPHTTQASLLIDWQALLHEQKHSAAVLRPRRDAWPGSSDPREWVVYGHVYPAAGGGLMIQYWFFYPFNDGHFLFDHEGDWEHITVRLDASLRPLGAYYARHNDCVPGPWFDWQSLAREGEHPVVLSARGTHASYASPGEVPWYDLACRTRDPAEAPRRGCRVWRTAGGAGAGGVEGVGQRSRPRAGACFIAWPGEWGAKGRLRRNGGCPPGPAFHADWCFSAGPECG